MNTTRWIGIFSIAASLVAYGCSSSPQGGNPSGDDGGVFMSGDDGSGGSSSGVSSSGGTSSGTASGGTTSSGGGSSSGAGSSGAGSSSGGSSSGAGSSGGSSSGGSTTTCGDAGVTNNSEIDYSSAPVVLTMTSFTVNQGQEVYYCQTFANPWGKAVDVKDYTLNMGVGSHHMFAFYATNATNVPLAACPLGGATFNPYTFTAQSPHAELTYPSTVGASVPAGTGFQLMVHYLNTGATPLQSNVSLTMYIAKPNVVTNHAGALFLNQPTMRVSNTCTTASGGCPSTATYTLPQDVEIMSTNSHMHKFGTNFVATASTGQTLFQTTQWDEPPSQPYCPTLHLSAGTTITWTCTDVNDTGGTLTFGQSALTNVMCIATALFYPVTNIANPVIGVL